MSEQEFNVIAAYNAYREDTLKSIWKHLSTSFGEDNVDIVDKYKESSEIQENWERHLLTLNVTSDEDFETKVIQRSHIGSNSLFYGNYSSYSTRLAIKFPKVTITNSEGRTHDIQDLYAFIFMTPNFRTDYSNYFYLTRGKMTLAEIDSNYWHSHASAGGVPSSTSTCYSGVCLGSTGMSSHMSILSTGYNDHDFGLFCAELQEYVKWESIEGIPHRRIGSISEGRRGGGGGYLHITTREKYEYMREIMKKYKASDFDIDLISNKYFYEMKLLKNEKFNRIIGEVAKPEHCDIYDPVTNERINRDGNNSVHYRNTRIRDINISALRNPLFKFKGKDVYFELLSKEKTEESKEEDYIKVAKTRLIDTMYHEFVMQLEKVSQDGFFEDVETVSPI